MSYLTALLALWLQATTPDSNLNSLAEQIEEVTVRGDVADLDRHAETLESWLQHEELSNRELCLYTVAYTKWRLAYLPGHEAIAERGVLLRDAESYLKVLLELNPEDPEAYALLGAVYGGQITSAWEKLTLGRKAQGALARAAKLAPDNPRVVLNRAVAKFYKPWLFGGGKDRAFTRASPGGGAFRAATTRPNLAELGKGRGSDLDRVRPGSRRRAERSASRVRSRVSLGAWPLSGARDTDSPARGSRRKLKLLNQLHVVRVSLFQSRRRHLNEGSILLKLFDVPSPGIADSRT